MFEKEGFHGHGITTAYLLSRVLTLFVPMANLSGESSEAFQPTVVLHLIYLRGTFQPVLVVLSSAD